MTMLAAAPALAVDRVPVAVVWMGDAASLETGGAQGTVEEVNLQLARTQTARPLDAIEVLRSRDEGGPETREQLD